MKKTISTILVCVLLVGSLLTLASCEVAGFVFGTYSRTDDFIIYERTTTYKFSLGKVEVTVESEGQITGSEDTFTTEYKYKVTENDEGEKIIVLTLETDDGTETNKLSFNSGKDDGGSYIEIGGVRYYSVK